MTWREQLERLERRTARFWVAAGCALVVAVGCGDYATGREFSFALFYLIPIMLVAWSAGRPAGLAVSVVAAATWFVADVLSGEPHASPFIPYWNAAVRFGIFAMVVLLLPVLRALEREREIARVDHLTGAANRRRLDEALQTELDRARRYRRPFTIVCFDLDGFKAVNDHLGHATGDRVLRAVVHRAKRRLRRTDLVARLGGDEFVLLLPEVGPQAARAGAPKIQAALLAEMRANRWPVTFSMGALTYCSGDHGAEDLMNRADALMYSVKASGRNAIAYAVCADADDPHGASAAARGARRKVRDGRERLLR